MKLILALLMMISVVLSSIGNASESFFEHLQEESSVSCTAQLGEDSGTALETRDCSETECHDCPVHCHSHCHSSNYLAAQGLPTSDSHEELLNQSGFSNRLHPRFSPSSLYRPPIA